MPFITNVSPLGDLVVPAFSLTVLAGQSVEVTDEQAQSLLAQPDNWQLATSTPTAE